MTQAEAGAADGAKERAKQAARGREFTPIGACQACGKAFERRMLLKQSTPADVVEYGTAFVRAALGETEAA